MFEHSIKVPRHFKIAANILKKVSEEGGSVKTLLYDNKLKHFRVNVLYALINETIKHAIKIEKLFENTGILVNEPRLDPWLAKVLTAELLYGKKTLPGKSKPEQTILSYREHFEKLTSEIQHDEKSKVVRRPRYVRINTNLLTTSDAIRAFQDEGYKFIRCTSGSYNDYLQQIQNLTEFDFTQDYHVKTIFVFSPGTKLHEHDLYLENKIILQDKATALAVHLLAAPSGSVVLDMCAAPGMKTTQLAAYLRNQGKIYAVERNEKRYETLCQYVEATESKCVVPLYKDSLEIKKGDLDDVEYILLDPSCSGSGMELSVHNYVQDTRLAKLTSLQEKFLKHAMNSFPKAKRIVYSTCSVFPEENERVVTNIVKASRAKWRVRDVKELLKDQWNNVGSGMYGSVGTRCLYAKSDSDFTIGFFLAVLDRDCRDNETLQVDGTNNLDGLSLPIKEYHGCLEKNYQKSKTNKKKEHGDNLSDIMEYGVIKSEKLSEDINYEYNDTKNIKKRRKKEEDSSKNVNVQTVAHDVLFDHENTSSNNTFDINNKFAKSKKKKHKSKVKDDMKNEGDITDTTDKPQFDLQELGVCNTETTKTKKKKNQKSLNVLETVEKKQLLENNNETEAEIPKKKKKKRKTFDEEIVEPLTKEISITDASELTDTNKRIPKKKKEHANSDVPQFELTQEFEVTDKKRIKDKKNKNKDMDDVDKLETECEELPKKKKKKHESLDS